MNWHEQIIVTRAVKDDVDLMSCKTRMMFGSLGIAKVNSAYDMFLGNFACAGEVATF